MDLISDRGRRVSVEELNTKKLLAHAEQQARKRNYQDMMIVDCDAHHYPKENFKDILPYMENDVLRQLVLSIGQKGAGSIVPQEVGFQDMGGRVTRYPLRKTEKTPNDRLRDAELSERWMDSMGIDYACLFPSGLLHLFLHPLKEMEVELCWAYNRWLTEVVLPEMNGRMYSMLVLPFRDPKQALRQVETFGGRKHVKGFLLSAVNTKMAVHDDEFMKVYRAIEERGLSIAFHSAPNWGDGIFASCNRFISVHSLGFSFYNILHCTNWVVNGLSERFPKLPLIWIEGGLAWVPFLMQRLDHEYMLRSSECPLLKRKPSEYMQEMYYSTQPMEVQNIRAMETTFEMINAETQLLYASDYPHWDFDLPSTVYDLPFLTEKAKHNILGGNAARLFGLEPRNEKQKENLMKYAS